MLRSLCLLPLLIAASAAAAPWPQVMPPPPAAQAPAPLPPPANRADAVRRIPLAELQAAVKSSQAVIVDVRSQAEYETGHIPGALHIPFLDMPQRAKELPHDRLIVTYCT